MLVNLDKLIKNSNMLFKKKKNGLNIFVFRQTSFIGVLLQKCGGVHIRIILQAFLKNLKQFLTSVLVEERH